MTPAKGPRLTNEKPLEGRQPFAAAVGIAVRL
jgi:hypothetical protein